MDLFEKYQLDKTQFRFGTREEMEEDTADIERWKKTTVEERLEALELLRQIHYGNYSPAGRIQGIFEFTERKAG